MILYSNQTKNLAEEQDFYFQMVKNEQCACLETQIIIFAALSKKTIKLLRRE
jgi:hypothetical protein